MIKLIDILIEQNKILVPRRSKEERQKNFVIATQKKIQQYIKDGSKGDLDLSDTPIKSLPDNLKVGGDLYLSYTPIQSLPDNLKVGGDLYLRNTPIQTLPDNLTIGRSLYLRNTPIQTLPDNLTIGRDLDLSYTPISEKYTKEQIRKMIEDKGGYIKEDIFV